MAAMKRGLPAAVAMAVGVFVLISIFLPQLNVTGIFFVDTAIIIAAFALLLGLINLMRVHLRHISNRKSGWPYSIVLIISTFVILAVGLLGGGPSQPIIQWIFDHVQAPIQAAFSALLVFFLVTAGYRLLRVRSLEAAIMLVVVLLVLAGQVTLGLVPILPEVRDWIVRVPAMAGVRGILLGVALGATLTGIRLLLGLERPYSD
ncbi:MAG: hypothetical protein PVI09_03520 [Anaerolineae bacterium]|jgi:hypothetical protein